MVPKLMDVNDFNFPKIRYLNTLDSIYTVYIVFFGSSRVIYSAAKPFFPKINKQTKGGFKIGTFSKEQHC